jgi:putative ABC transport system ATP-binding protein
VPGRQYWNEPRNTPDLEGIRSLSTVESNLWVAEADTLRAARGTNCELQDTSYGGKLTEMAFNGTATMAANEPVLSAVHAGTPILQIRDLRTNLLELAALSLSAGECIAVQGPSGAGKTLLLRAIADLDPNEGIVCLEGRDRSTIPGPGWRRLVGYVPAEPGWWADTVGEHFSQWTAALALVRDLGFPEEAKGWPIVRLSTGERLRLALIRALVVRPKVLLLDEPTAALDPTSVAAVESLIATRVRAGLAVLWVTHDAEQAKRIAHRLLVVKSGQVREEVPEWAATSR